MSEITRSFDYMVIPMFIWDNSNLTAIDRNVYAEINSLDNHLNGGDYCYASNTYLADFCGCSERKISDSIHKLVEMGYIRVVKSDGRKRWIESLLKERLEKFANQTSKNCEADTQILRQSLLVENINDKDSGYNNKRTIFTDSMSVLQTDEENKKSYSGKFIWHNDNQYNDYVENILPDYIKTVSGYYDKYADEVFEYIYDIVKTYFRYYTKAYETFHPWLNVDNLYTLADNLISYDNEELDREKMLLRIDQWFRMERKNDGNINAFASKSMLHRIDRRLRENGRTYADIK